MRVAINIELTSAQRQQLEAAPRSRSLPLRVVEHARIVLLAAEGLRNDQIAQRLSMSRFKVSR
jgi:LuxR family transcriptional regulator, maltose regulon positive regulatory protein